MEYKQKYLKYKAKYLALKNQIGGHIYINDVIKYIGDGPIIGTVVDIRPTFIFVKTPSGNGKTFQRSHEGTLWEKVTPVEINHDVTPKQCKMVNLWLQTVTPTREEYDEYVNHQMKHIHPELRITVADLNGCIIRAGKQIPPAGPPTPSVSKPSLPPPPKPSFGPPPRAPLPGVEVNYDVSEKQCKMVKQWLKTVVPTKEEYDEYIKLMTKPSRMFRMTVAEVNGCILLAGKNIPV